MSLAFKSSLLRDSSPSFKYDFEYSVTLNLGRGGGARQSSDATTLSPPSPTNETETIVTISDILTDDDESISSISSVPYNFSLFQKGDGSETDPDGIPGRFLRMQKGNREKAMAALEHTLEWRQEHQVDTILSRPHPKYDVCKSACPQYFGGRDPTGHVIFVQRPGKISLASGEINNVTTDDLLSHYIYLLEYCWNEIEPRPDQTMTSVIDLGGLHLKQVRKMFGFVKEFVNMMSLHYPQRSYKTLLINSPKWFGATFRLIKPILRESTRSKIQILSGGEAQREALRKYLGEFAPTELLYDETDHETKKVDENDHTGPNSPMEQMLRAFVMERLDETGEIMQPILEVESQS